MNNPAIFWGKVVVGEQRGKSLGFPTVNVRLHKNIPEGIYVSVATVDRRQHEALTFIGSAKTFGEKEVKAETYFLSYNGNIYGKWISVRLFLKIRGNKKFESAMELVLQMKKDKRYAKEYFKKNKHV